MVSITTENFPKAKLIIADAVYSPIPGKLIKSSYLPGIFPSNFTNNFAPLKDFCPTIVSSPDQIVRTSSVFACAKLLRFGHFFINFYNNLSQFYLSLCNIISDTSVK